MQILGGLSFTGGFTVTPLAAAIAAAADDYFKYVTLLLRGEGTNGAQNATFLDSSSTAKTVTRTGDVVQGTASPFSKEAGKWGVYLDGTGDYFTLTNSTDFKFGTSTTAFSVEFWLYMDAKPGSDRAIMGNYKVISYPTNTNGWDIIYVNTPGAVAFRWGYPNYADTGTTGTINIGAWNHIVVCRNSSGVLSQFTNGTRTFTTSTNTSITDSDAASFWLGWAGSLSGTTINPIPGNISNVRILKGSSAYDASQSTITVPTAPLTAVANTKLLTCQDNSFRDNSTNNFKPTPNGDVVITPFSPFTSAAEYSIGANGGSYYFDGAGDYLSYGSSADFTFGTGDFTVEAWIYNTGTDFSVFNVGGAALGSYSLYWLNSDKKFQSVRYGDTAGAGTTTNTYPINQWLHIAAVRSGGTAKLYINGVEDTGATYAMGDITATAGESGRIWQTNTATKGFISNLRVVKGTAVYTGNFTPATAPLSDISNTKLLLLGTNAGIIDSVKTSILEVSGGAQISTAQEQFGSSSMYFDGSGDFIEAFASGNMYQFGTGDFTFEAWIKSTTSGTYNGPFGQFPAGTVLGKWDIKTRYLNANNFIFTYNNGTNNVDLAASPAVNLNDDAWHHIAVTRSGTTIRMFSDGVLRHSASISASQVIGVAGQPIYLGYNPTDAAYYTGYIDDLRITKGVARYTANFTPPAATFPGN